MTGNNLLLFCILSLSMTSGYAETFYVIDELKVGLHKDKTTESPIVKLVPSGTALEVLGRDGELIQVKAPDGESGWVHQDYLIAQASDNARLLELQKENTALEKEIQKLKTEGKTDTGADTTQLEQQLKSERLKVGELQAQLADIKANLPNTDEELREEMSRLQQANNELVSQLALAGVDTEQAPKGLTLDAKSWKIILIALASLFIIGMAAGAFFLDYVHRRRHGGFRV